MPRKYFDQKLADLNRSMKEMGAVVDRRIGETMEALKNLDKDLAAEVDEVVEVVAGIPQRIKPGSPGAKAQNRQDSRG